MEQSCVNTERTMAYSDSHEIITGDFNAKIGNETKRPTPFRKNTSSDTSEVPLIMPSEVKKKQTNKTNKNKNKKTNRQGPRHR